MGQCRSFLDCVCSWCRRAGSVCKFQGHLFMDPSVKGPSMINRAGFWISEMLATIYASPQAEQTLKLPTSYMLKAILTFQNNTKNANRPPQKVPFWNHSHLEQNTEAYELVTSILMKNTSRELYIFKGYISKAIYFTQKRLMQLLQLRSDIHYINQ